MSSFRQYVIVYSFRQTNGSLGRAQCSLMRASEIIDKLNIYGRGVCTRGYRDRVEVAGLEVGIIGVSLVLVVSPYSAALNGAVFGLSATVWRLARRSLPHAVLISNFTPGYGRRKTPRLVSLVCSGDMECEAARLTSKGCAALSLRKYSEIRIADMESLLAGWGEGVGICFRAGREMLLNGSFEVSGTLSFRCDTRSGHVLGGVLQVEPLGSHEVFS
nr:hypothetical protein Iba_chr10dCG12110 [Ipomoea batatas]